ncbi:cation:proton antiporter [Rhizobium sp. NPDC090279]|uniref:cation:proton antiporter n=1 Tax=Rhizobium sp. NPDC090279 TaxID=3364499 RepID=UPI00383BEC49
MADAVGQLGIVFLLLLASMETDLGLAKRLRKSAAGVSLTGIVIPFAAGFALGELIPDALLPDPERRLVTSLFLGTALSISSVKIVATVVREMDFMRRNIGQLIVASAIIDDTVGWVIIAITFGLAGKGHGRPHNAGDQRYRHGAFHPGGRIRARDRQGGWSPLCAPVDRGASAGESHPAHQRSRQRPYGRS